MYDKDFICRKIKALHILVNKYQSEFNNNLDSTVITVLSNLEYKETFNLIESNHTEC